MADIAYSVFPAGKLAAPELVLAASGRAAVLAAAAREVNPTWRRRRYHVRTFDGADYCMTAERSISGRIFIAAP